MHSEAATATHQALSTTLRPPRAVVVFNGGGDWMSHAAQAMYECGRVWGGSGFILVPHHNGEVHPALIRLAVDYDPDYVLVAQTTQGQSEAIYPGGIRVRDGESGEFLTGEARASVLQHSTASPMLDPVGHKARDLVASACTPHRYMIPRDDGSEEPHEQQQVLGLRDDRFGGQHPLSRLPELKTDAEQGPLGVPADVQGPWGLAAAIRYGISEPPSLPYTNSSPISFDDAKGIMAAALPTVRGYGLFRDEEPWTSAWSASEAGAVRVQPWQASRKHHLVVVGCSADDFALALGWQVLFGNSFWIPEGPPFGKQVTDRVLWGLAHDMLSEIEYHHREVFLTSTTVDQHQLEEIATGWSTRHEPVVAAWENDDGEWVSDETPPKDPPLPRVADPVDLDFADGGLLVVRDQYDIPLALPASVDEHGGIRLLVDLPPLTPTHPDLDTVPEITWQIDLHAPGYRTPKMRGLTPSVLQYGDNARESFVRSSRSGLTCYSASWGFVMAGSTRVQAMARPRLAFPSLLAWTEAMAIAGGYTTRFSDAGHRVEVLRRLWGGRANLARDWSGPLRPILLAFHTHHKKTSDAFPEHDGMVIRSPEAYLSFDAMARLDAVADQEAPETLTDLRRMIDRLCGLGALRRGLILRCGACKEFAYLNVDEVSASNPCRRCGATIPLEQSSWGLPISEPRWFYDLHPAARELLAQDAGVGLLAADYLRTKARTYDDVSELEFVDATGPVAEIDLLAAVDGRVVIGEAKATPRLGTRTERAGKARKLAKVAAAVRADEIVLCTTSSSTWSEADLGAIHTALTEAFPMPARLPMVRSISGLGSTPTES